MEEVKNLLEPLSRISQATPAQQRRRKLDVQPTPKPNPTPIRIASLETPISRPKYTDFMPSAMKGVVLTATGETLATPAPAELANLFNSSPKVGLNFAKIFDFEDGGEKHGEDHHDDDEALSPPPSPSSRKEREKVKDREKDDGSESSTSSNGATPTTKQQPLPPTRLRRPSIRSSARASTRRTETLPASVSEPIISTSAAPAPAPSHAPKPLPHPHLRPSGSSSNLAAIGRAATLPIPVPRSHPSPEYDFADEENLPSPFLKRIDKGAAAKAAAAAAASTTSSVTTAASTGSVKVKRRGSSGLMLRAVAAANSAGRRGATPTVQSPEAESDTVAISSSGSDGPESARPSLASARKASEEARKALLRP